MRETNINYKTNKLFARVISNSVDKNNKIYAFGDSQLLGIDWDTSYYEKHDLSKIYKKSDISIFAAPNNGPFQSINFTNYILMNSNTKIKHIVYTLNYGNDIFRLQKKWNLKNFVPLESDDLSKIMSNPSLYDLILLKGLLSGKFFSTNL